MTNNIPCYRCLFTEPLKARTCRPFLCVEFEDWLQAQLIVERVENVERICCPHCGSPDTMKNGFYRYNGSQAQKYRCRSCRSRFIYRSGFGFKKKFKLDIVAYANLLSDSQDPAYSTRDIAQLILQKYQVDVSHVSVGRWLRPIPKHLCIPL